MADLQYASQEVEITNQNTGVKCNPDINGNLPVIAGQTGDWAVGITGTVPLPTGASTLAGQTAGNASLVAINAGITGIQVTDTAILAGVTGIQSFQAPILAGITGIKAQTDLMTFGSAPGKFALNTLDRARLEEGFSPDPYFQPYDKDGNGEMPLTTIASGSLVTRGQALTDEGSFRDDFGADLVLGSTGTAVFTNGSAMVTGTGFLSESLSKEWVIKAAAHTTHMYTQVARVESDTVLYLASAYPGANAASATYSKAMWKPTVVGTGSFNVASSILNLVGETAANTVTQATRESDYGPLTFYAKAMVSQRIANQQAVLGFSEGANTGACAYFSFTGTDNTKVTLVTANSSSSADKQQTTFTLPSALTTASYCNYRIEQRNQVVRAFVNDVIVATHETHIPGPYDSMYTVLVMSNTGVASSATTLSVDTIYVANFDSLEVNITSKGQKPVSDSVSMTMALDEGGINVINNIVFAATWEATFNSTAEQNFFVLTNGASSAHNMMFTNCYLEQTASSAYAATARFYSDPTAVSGGVAGSIANRLIGSSVTSLATLLTGAQGSTITATKLTANKILTFSQGTSGTTAIIPIDGEIVLPPGHSLLVTTQVSNVSGIAALTLVWREVPIIA